MTSIKLEDTNLAHEVSQKENGAHKPQDYRSLPRLRLTLLKANNIQTHPKKHLQTTEAPGTPGVDSRMFPGG